MNIEQKNVYGSDVQYYDNKDFNFIKLEKNNEMEIINTGSIDLITCSMVLHHVVDIESALKELRRVISNDGILIIREHDCINKTFASFLDILHGLYGLVWSEPIEDPNFINEYKASYKNSEEWTKIITSFGFTKINEIRHNKSNIRAYYAVYAAN